MRFINEKVEEDKEYKYLLQVPYEIVDLSDNDNGIDEGEFNNVLFEYTVLNYAVLLPRRNNQKITYIELKENQVNPDALEFLVIAFKELTQEDKTKFYKQFYEYVLRNRYDGLGQLEKTEVSDDIYIKFNTDYNNCVMLNLN